ncbi:MAG: hypothetical protein BZ138_08115 [Methanosphaera sp. rholeuAM270]|nr:MAG: hypothetical protein BZ138_08115 [Methanosphaera sp. rholeuAM270]
MNEVIEMDIETIVGKELKRYNFELNDLGVQCIIIQIKLVYGNNPTIKQIREIIKNNKISFINEHKKVIKNDIN